MREYLFEVLEGGGDLSMQTVFIRLVMAVVIAAFIYLSYRLSHNGSIYSQKFNVSLAVMTIVTATVMIVIGDNIALSPQCGFASVEEGNAITEDVQWQKIDLLVSCREWV